MVLHVKYLDHRLNVHIWLDRNNSMLSCASVCAIQSIQSDWFVFWELMSHLLRVRHKC